MDKDIITKNDAPNIFIDCSRCDMGFIRTELQYVNYVIDRNDADIFLMITRQGTASGGTMHTLTTEGRGEFAGMNDTLMFVVDQDMTDDEARKEVVEWIERGLVKYLIHTPLVNDMLISFRQAKPLEQPEDKWNYWVFRTSMNAWFDGESSYQSLHSNYRFRASRTTEALKLRATLHADLDKENYDLVDTTIISESSSQSLSLLYVKSISDHFSVGATAGIRSSTYSNLKQALWLNPTVEYNYFPYSESTRRELTFKYQIGYDLNNYSEVTIFDKTEEQLLSESLRIEYEVKEPWGSTEFTLSGSHYFDDLEKYRLDIWAKLSLKLLKGFSFDLRGNYSMIHDQLTLPKGGASQEEILLHRQEMATQYDYWGSMGISYTFGSIYNNIVNPRF
ncbi:MAG: hypothetical protein K9N38_09070 [Candidatus Marinimicrobia bacterium]|nr:hypothetical protein [Candidatus Neomarinimicrobiota bacterium]MCF7851318.1 hypothetical protein [Candidatus Neomarinimicrobiota bacterium]